MGYVSFGLSRPRITLFDVDGITPLVRITLQKETREGLELSFKPEGVSRQMGSGAGWANRWLHRGFRPLLTIKWTHGLISQLETWDGSNWETATSLNTAEALSTLFSKAFLAPCQVLPHLDMNFDFLAQPDPGKAFMLRDLKGFAHTALELNLIGTTLIPAIPEWANLNNYFEPGYVDPDFITATPPTP